MSSSTQAAGEATRSSVELTSSKRLQLEDFYPLSRAERSLLQCCTRGEITEIARRRPARVTVRNSVRASFVRFLVLSDPDKVGLHEVGVRLRGAWITGVLDLDAANCRVPLALKFCRLNIVRVRQARLISLSFAGSRIVSGLSGDRLHCEGSLFLDEDVIVTGEIRLAGARIDGSLYLKGKLINKKGRALEFSRISVLGDLMITSCVTLGGVSVRRAKIGGSFSCGASQFKSLNGAALDLDGANVSGSIDLTPRFFVAGEVRLVGAIIRGSLNCGGGRFDGCGGRAIYLPGAEISEHVLFRSGFHATGIVDLQGAKIGRGFVCSSGHFQNPNGVAISMSTSVIGGFVDLGLKFKVEGEVRLNGLRLSGDLVCRGVIRNEGNIALAFSRARISGNVLFGAGFKAYGFLQLQGTKVEGDLSWSNSEIINKNGKGIDARGASVSGYLLLRGKTEVVGVCDWTGITVGRDLECSNIAIRNGDVTAMNCAGSSVSGSVIFKNDCVIEGGVRFNGAEIGGSFLVYASRFANPSKVALSMDRAKIGGSVHLRGGFYAAGSVILNSARIGVNLDCSRSRFEAQNRTALCFELATIRGSVKLTRGFSASGRVSMLGSAIEGDLLCLKATFENDHGIALLCSRSRVAGGFFFRSNVVSGEVNLGAMTTGSLHDDEPSWGGARGKLTLDGFVYHRLLGRSPVDAEARIRWLDLQPPAHVGDEFRPQPWEQIASVLRATGHTQEARALAIAKQHRLRRSGKIARGVRAFHRAYGLLVGYGYKPFRLLTVTAVVWLTCAGIYWAGVNPTWYGATTPSLAPVSSQSTLPTQANRFEEDGYYHFDALVFSADILIPVVDLGYASEWRPVMFDSEGRPLIVGSLVRYTRWLEIIFGWLVGILLITALRNLVKKD